MASTHKSLRSGTANKRPTTSIADGQIALNTNTTSPGLFFKDSTGATIIKIGPVHVGTTAPNASPAAGGSSGNSTGEVWLDTSLTPNGVKIWNGASWTNATPIGSTTVQGLLELATNAETQTGTDPDRAVTPAGLQSKVSDSTSTTSSTTIASSTAVKSAYDLANAALPKSGGTVTGNLEIGTTGSLSFEGATADAFETTIAVVDPTADRTITLPDTTGTIVTTGDTGTVTSTMIADGTIVDADINASAAIAHSKLASITAGQVLLGNASNVPTSTALSGDVTVTSSGVTAISTGVIVNADVNASAAIAGTKISPDFGSQNVTTTGTSTAASFIPTSSTVPTNGVYLPSANNVAISTNGTGRLFVNSSGSVGIGNSSPGKELDVTGQIRCSARFQTLADALVSDWIYIGSSSGARGITSDSASRSLLFGINGTEVARIDTSGRLGVGTSSPSSLLHVEGTAGNAKIRLGTGGDHTIIGPDSSGHTIINAGTSGGNMQLQLAGSTKVTLNSTGLGVGTTTPRTNFQIGEFGGSNTDLQFAAGTSGASNILFGDGSTGTDFYRGFIKYNHSTDSLEFATAATERARIDSSGRLGVGTTSPTAPVHIKADDGIKFENVSLSRTWGILPYTGGGSPNANFRIYDYTAGADRLNIDTSGRVLVGTSSSSATNTLVVQGHSGGSTGQGIVYLAKGSATPADGDQLGAIWFSDNTHTASAGINGQRDGGTWSASSKPTRLVFSTTADGASSPTERMRINNLGRIFTYNANTGNNSLTVASAATAGTAVANFIGAYGATGVDTGTSSFIVWTNGNVQNTNNSYTAISDAKLKENIIDANSQWNDIKSLQVRNYNLKEGQTHKQIGLIAQEVEPISPGLVYESPDRDEDGNDLGTVTKSVNYSVLYMKAVKALQEAMERIEQLEAKVAALEAA